MSYLNKSTITPIFISKDVWLDTSTHTYNHVSNPTQKYVSCTTKIKPLFEPFDPTRIATDLVQNHPRYKDRTIESLITEWRYSGENGSASHKEAEYYILTGVQPSIPKGIQACRWIDKVIATDLYDWYPEVIVYNNELGIAGTIDLILVNRHTGKLTIVDWKTNKKITKTGFRNKKGCHLLSQDKDDCEFSIYSFQLSIYRYLLETYYGQEVVNAYLVHLTEGDAVTLKALYYKEEIEILLEGY